LFGGMLSNRPFPFCEKRSFSSLFWDSLIIEKDMSLFQPVDFSLLRILFHPWKKFCLFRRKLLERDLVPGKKSKICLVFFF